MILHWPAAAQCEEVPTLTLSRMEIHIGFERVNVVMPAFLSGNATYEITTWLKAPGDKVAEGDVLASVRGTFRRSLFARIVRLRSKDESQSFGLKSSGAGTFLEILVGAGQPVAAGIAVATMVIEKVTSEEVQEKPASKEAVLKVPGTHLLVCVPAHVKASLNIIAEMGNPEDQFVLYESMGAEFRTKQDIVNELADIGKRYLETQKPIIWRINHIDAVSNVVAYVLHSLMVNDYVTHRGQKFGAVPQSIIAFTSNPASVPRILMSAFHIQRTYDEVGRLTREESLHRGAPLPDLTRGIYFLRAGEQGNIKIGKTYDLKARLASLQTGSPEPLHLLAFVNCLEVDPTEAEAMLHKKFQHHRLQGEWFMPADELLEFVRGLGMSSEAVVEGQEVVIRDRSGSRSHV